MRGGKRGFTPAGSALSSALSGVDLANLANLGRLEKGWADIVGPQLAEVSRPAKVAFRELTVFVAEPVWADAMNFHRSRIVERTNVLLGKAVIDRVRLSVQPDAMRKPPPPPPPRPTRPPTAEEEAAVEAALVGVADSELRSILRRVILKSVAVDRHHEPEDDGSSSGPTRA